MKKLTTVFSMLAFSTVLAVTGCKKGDGDADKANAKPTEAETKPAETKPADTTPAETKPADPTPTETKPAETKPVDTTPADTTPAAAGDLPAECNEYKAAIEALAKCDKLPQATRDALKQSYDQTSAAWATVPAEGKAALGTACKSAADAVKQSAAACN